MPSFGLPALEHFYGEDRTDICPALDRVAGTLPIAGATGCARLHCRAMKLVALAVAGEGHWYTGIAMVIAAYAVSLFVVERLFVIVKPKLLRI